jgi:hypothetical protein
MWRSEELAASTGAVHCALCIASPTRVTSILRRRNNAPRLVSLDVLASTPDPHDGAPSTANWRSNGLARSSAAAADRRSRSCISKTSMGLDRRDHAHLAR